MDGLRDQPKLLTETFYVPHLKEEPSAKSSQLHPFFLEPSYGITTVTVGFSNPFLMSSRLTVDTFTSVISRNLQEIFD